MEINHIKGKFGNTQQSIKCRLRGERWNSKWHNTWMHQTSTKKYKIRHDYVEKVIHWELSNSNLTILPNSICPNQNPSQRIRHRKFSGTFKYRYISPHPGQKTRPSVDYQEKKNLSFNGFCRSRGSKSKNKRKRKKKANTRTLQENWKEGNDGEIDINCS